mmetsp:Transcript_29238/g.45802  ORF Transcript_29238/g.45802 Transcript_29238/m.45802 type:complete len:574 (+) Transcript_29238:293-2014(+)
MVGSSWSTRGMSGGGTGSASMTVHGSSLGMAEYSGWSNVGQTGFEGTRWISGTKLQCKVGGLSPAGCVRVSATVISEIGSLSEAMSADTVAVSEMGMRNVAGRTGVASVTVHGRNLGEWVHSGRSRVGETGCQATGWESEASVRCRLSKLTSAGTRIVRVTGGARIGSLSEGMTTDLMGMIWEGSGNMAGGTGSSSLTVHGSSFGMEEYSGRSRVGVTGCEATAWASETSIWCDVKSLGWGCLRVLVTVQSQTKSMSNAMSADTVGMSGLGRINVCSTGSASVTVHGRSLGAGMYSGISRIGGSGSERTLWESETTMQCQVGASSRSGSQQGILTVGLQTGSLSEAMSLENVGMHELGRSNAMGRTGSTSVTVYGISLGVRDPSLRSTGGGTGCEATGWESASSMRCQAGASVPAGSLTVSVTVGSRTGTMSEVVSSDMVGVSGVSRTNLDGSTGLVSLTIQGRGLVMSEYSGSSRVGQTGCKGKGWESETSIRCKAAVSASGSRAISVSVNCFSSSLSLSVTYDHAGYWLASFPAVLSNFELTSVIYHWWGSWGRCKRGISLLNLCGCGCLT